MKKLLSTFNIFSQVKLDHLSNDTRGEKEYKNISYYYWKKSGVYQLIGSFYPLSHYLQGFITSKRWFSNAGISAINKYHRGNANVTLLFAQLPGRGEVQLMQSILWPSKKSWICWVFATQKKAWRILSIGMKHWEKSWNHIATSIVLQRIMAPARN